jgi:protein-S-isoprenylcysteine O-methyltransferase Ste14
MQARNLGLRFCFQTVFWLGVMAVMLLAGADNLRWPQGWAFLLIFGLGSALFGAWLIRRDPALLAVRLERLSQPGQPLWDKLFLLVLVALWLLWLWLMGRDAQVWQISHMPWGLNLAGGVLLVAGFLGVARVFKENSFAAPVVRVQTERRQRVVDTGPYARVRHPMYFYALFYLFGTPLLLGSWLGMAGALVMVLGLMGRAVREEDMLTRRLAGYDEYRARVRYRLIPGIW